MLNGSDLEWHFKTEQPKHLKSNQIAAIVDFYALVLLLNGQDYSYMVQIILILNHPKSKHLNFEWVLNLNVRYSSPHCEVMFQVLVLVSHNNTTLPGKIN